MSPERTEGYTLTVFTPTFNHSSALPRVYHSLNQQTLPDFEWVIVDDGSSGESNAAITLNSLA